MKNKTTSALKALLWGLLVILFPVASGVLSAVLSLGKIQTLLLQSGFMALSLVPPLALVLSGKWKLRDLGFRRFERPRCKKALYFIPVAAVLVPVAVSGFYVKSLPYVLCSLLLYVLVGAAEELYFRGIAVKYLASAFSQKGVIILSTLIFGIGHLATAFTGVGALDTALTVLNAFIFGWLAVEITLLSGNLTLAFLLHFLFDFQTKITAASGFGLLLAECARGAIMVILAVWLAFVLKKSDVTNAAELTEPKRKKRAKRRVTALCVVGALVLASGGAAAGLAAYGRAQSEKIPAMSFEECLAYTLAGSENGVITVGTLRDGRASYTVYGKDAKPLANSLHTYEIGSITKTFTAALIERAASEGRLGLEDTVDKYLPLSEGNAYPTIAALLTHTSGLAGYYIEPPMARNYFTGENDFRGVSDEMALAKLAALDIKPKEYAFEYSNYGYAVLGLVLEAVYGEEYAELVNGFAAELGLQNTHISRGGDLGGCWEWEEDDVYLSAGGLTSNIEDMLEYARLQLEQADVFGLSHEALREIDATTPDNEMMNIRMDAAGAAWMIDTRNGVIWHNGATDGYNCYLGFCPERGEAVVILSNLPPDYRIPATVMGIKLLTGRG